MPVRFWKLYCSDPFWPFYSVEVAGISVHELEDLPCGFAVLFEGISSSVVQLLQNVLDGDPIDVQVKLESGRHHVDLMIADSRDPAHSTRYTTLAASTLQSIDIEYETLVIWRAMFDVGIAKFVTDFAVCTWFFQP